METPNKYYFSEHDFDGFYNLEISWDDQAVEAKYFIPGEAEAAYQRSKDREEAEEFITGGYFTRPPQFYIECKGTRIEWRNVQKVSYYEIKEPNRYGFRIALQGSTAEEEVVISAKTAKDVGTTKPVAKANLEILDAVEIENPYFKQREYLQEMYAALVEVLSPPATKMLVQQYQRRLKTNQTIKIGKLVIQPKGVVLKKKGWLRKKKMVVTWSNLGSIFEKGKLYLMNRNDENVQLVIQSYDLINKDAIETLIEMGKAGTFE